MKDTIEFAVGFIAFGFVIFALMQSLNGWLDLPTVYTSNSTGRCVKIELSDGSIVGCDRLKEFDKYENVWVK